MLKNYLKTSLRNLLRYKSYSAINIFGLTIGLATSIFIFLWVTDELSYDKFHDKGDRAYRVISNFTFTDGSIETGWATPVNMAEAMQQDIPEIDQVLRTSWDQEMLFKYGSKSITETGLYADSTIFSIFTFPIVQGDAHNPLPDLKSVAISEKLAHKFFGNEDALGKVFRVNQQYDLTVTSVFKDIPENSSLRFDFIISYNVWLQENKWADGSWGNNCMQTYASLKQGASLEDANKKMYNVIMSHCKDCINNPMLFLFQDLRLHSEFKNGKSVGGRIDYIVSFSLVALIVLIIACINFMNLATARSATRSREVGVRKSIGAQRSGLITQFIGESILLAFIALICALTLVEIMLPLFNSMTEKSIRPDYTDPLFISGLLVITVFCGLLAGSYPAIFLSSFKPSQVLKGNTSSILSGGGLRKTLVVVQFVASIILIVGSLVVHNQISFIQQKHLGFDKDNIVAIRQYDGFVKNRDAYKNELMQHASIRHVAVVGHNPFSVGNTTTDPAWPGKPEGSMISFQAISCDQEFIPTLNIPLAAGRNFIDLNKQDSTNYIINEEAMKVMGLTLDNVIGTELTMWNGKGKIIGVTRNFNSSNLRQSIMPVVFVYQPENTWKIFVKVSGNPKEALAHIEQVHKKFDPDYPFSYSFLNEDFNREYKNEALIGNLSMSFTMVTIIISALGLLGLASFTAERRMKELGIRKVLGASVTNLVALLCSDFIKLAVIALVISLPLAAYFAHTYLTGYVFHAPLTAWIFVLPAVGILGITLATVGYQSARAAMNNPANSLRSE